MLCDLLAGDLIAWMEDAPDKVPRRVVLWLDPEGQFARLVPYLGAALGKVNTRLLRPEPDAGRGLFAIKVVLLRLEATEGERAVVYLPGFGRQDLEPRPDGDAPGLWALYEYRYKGCIWGCREPWEAGAVPDPVTLLGWLAGHGLQVADDKTAQDLAAGGDQSLLARYAEQQRDSVPQDWPRPLRRSDVLATLGGNPRDSLRGLLAAPTNEVKRWSDNRSLVLERIAAEYGLAAPGHDAPAEVIADAFAVQLALTEAWDAFGHPDDFPFLSRIPAKTEQRQKQARFLRDDVIKHSDLAPAFRRRVLRLEPQYNLAAWAGGRSGEPVGLPLLARSRWQQFLDEFNAAATRNWKEARELVLARRDAVLAAAKNAWEVAASHGAGIGERDTCWAAVADLATLVAEAGVAGDEAAGLSSAADMVSAYAGRWWKVDWMHLQVRAACSPMAGLEQVRRVADMAYFEYAVRVNERFVAAVAQSGKWPPDGLTGIGSIREALWRGNAKRRAVIISDACRWDFAETLKDDLATPDCTLAPVIATLPTNTGFGMAAMLPLEQDGVTVEFGTGDAVIRHRDGTDLATRGGRRDFLRKALAGGDGKSLVEFVGLEALMRGEKIPNVPFLVVFDNRLDELGHKGTEALPGLARKFVGDLKRAIEKLHAAGIPAVHLVTDHGFLLLPPEEVDAQGTPEVLPSQTYHKDYRWAAIKPEAPVTGLVRLPLPLGPGGVTLGFPRGIRTLVKAPAYIHGGISLQECVIPYLVSHSNLPQVRVGVDLRVTQTRLSGGTVPLVLRPAISEIQHPLGGIQPATVRVTIETVPTGGELARQVAEPIEVELRPDSEDLRPGLYIKEGLGLKAGQELIVRGNDVETGEDRGKILLTLLVDWD